MIHIRGLKRTSSLLAGGAHEELHARAAAAIEGERAVPAVDPLPLDHLRREARLHGRVCVRRRGSHLLPRPRVRRGADEERIGVTTGAGAGRVRQAVGEGHRLERLGLDQGDAVLGLLRVLVGLDAAVDRRHDVVGEPERRGERELVDDEAVGVEALVQPALGVVQEGRLAVAVDGRDGHRARFLVQDVPGEVVHVAVGQHLDVGLPEPGVEARGLRGLDVVGDGDVGVDGQALAGSEGDGLVVDRALVPLLGPDLVLDGRGELDHLLGEGVVRHPAGHDREVLHAARGAGQVDLDADVADVHPGAARAADAEEQHCDEEADDAANDEASRDAGVRVSVAVHMIHDPFWLLSLLELVEKRVMRSSPVYHTMTMPRAMRLPLRSTPPAKPRSELLLNSAWARGHTSQTSRP